MKLAHNYYVYIVRCSDGLYYTGVTNNLDRRLAEHNEGYNIHCFTFSRRPVVLQYYEHFVNIQNAIAREMQLKGWSRQKKEALFRTAMSEEWRRTEEKMRDQEKRGE